MMLFILLSYCWDHINQRSPPGMLLHFSAACSAEPDTRCVFLSTAGTDAFGGSRWRSAAGAELHTVRQHCTSVSTESMPLPHLLIGCIFRQRGSAGRAKPFVGSRPFAAPGADFHILRQLHGRLIGCIGKPSRGSGQLRLVFCNVFLCLWSHHFQNLIFYNRTHRAADAPTDGIISKNNSLL